MFAYSFCSADLMSLENCRLLFLTELFEIEKPGTQLTEQDIQLDPTASPAKRKPFFSPVLWKQESPGENLNLSWFYTISVSLTVCSLRLSSLFRPLCKKQKEKQWAVIHFHGTHYTPLAHIHVYCCTSLVLINCDYSVSFWTVAHQTHMCWQEPSVHAYGMYYCSQLWSHNRTEHELCAALKVVNCFAGQNKPECDFCKDNPRRKCKHCACCVCGGKNEPEKQLMCDECDRAYHLDCLNPPLTSVPPDDDWWVTSVKLSCVCGLSLIHISEPTRR